MTCVRCVNASALAGRVPAVVRPRFLSKNAGIQRIRAPTGRRARRKLQCPPPFALQIARDQLWSLTPSEAGLGCGSCVGYSRAHTIYILSSSLR